MNPAGPFDVVFAVSLGLATLFDPKVTSDFNDSAEDASEEGVRTDMGEGGKRVGVVGDMIWVAGVVVGSARSSEDVDGSGRRVGDDDDKTGRLSDVDSAGGGLEGIEGGGGRLGGTVNSRGERDKSTLEVASVGAEDKYGVTLYVVVFLSDS
jgi:hypothetical protein